MPDSNGKASLCFRYDILPPMLWLTWSVSFQQLVFQGSSL